MKIKLINLHDGLNHLKIKTDAAELGFEDDEELQSIFADKVELDIEVQKLSDKYFIKLFTVANGHFVCDRCLCDFQQAVKNKFQLVYSTETRNKFEDDVYRFLEENASEIDLTGDVRENLLLSLPMKHICSENCQGLCPTCGANLNEQSCNCSKDAIDPRWEKLKSLK